MKDLNYFLERIREERERQDIKWGANRNQDPTVWLTILQEEVGEVAKEICESNFDPENLSQNYETELVQVIAVALAMLENFDKYDRRILSEREKFSKWLEEAMVPIKKGWWVRKEVHALMEGPNPPKTIPAYDRPAALREYQKSLKSF